MYVLWTTVGIAGMTEDLIQASERGDLPAVQSLIAKGAKVDAKVKGGSTALM
jgi:hypothetical protein